MPATLRLPAPPARRPSANPASDPRFKVVKDRLTKGSSNLKKHPPAAKKALEAQKAALPPAKEKLVGAQANQVDTIQEAKAKKPDPNSFLALLRAEIEKVMPKNLDQADNFMEGGEQQQMKGAVTGKVDAQKQEASGEIKSATDQAPDQSKVVGKVVTPMPGEPTPVMPGINAGEGMPQARPEADVSQQQNKKNADQQMADAEVTPQQMQKANDPRFSSVLAAKTQVEKVADAAPAKYRTGEKAALAKAVVGAQSQSKLGISALLGVKTKSGTAVKSRQQIAKEKDEARRKEVGDSIEKIYNQTKLNVEAKLASLETDVSRLFDVGANAAIDNMKNNSRREIEKFKDDRYSGIRGWGRWIADRFRDVPPEIKQILQRNRAKFTQEMDTLVVRIASVVETRLQQAKNEITQGQGRIKSYVAGLPKDLQAVGKAAEKEMAGRFEELQQGIEDRKNALAQKLAQQYKEASDKADKALQEIEDENRSALYGFIAKLAEIVKILLEFKNKLMSILRKGWETIKLILADPIGFLSNLISAIKGGFEAFVNNIWEHLKKGFMKWLFGALAGAGIEIPSDLSLPSILKLVLSVLGITYEKMRAKAVKLLGPTAVAVIEKVVEYIRTLVTGGPAALWEKIKEDLSNLKEMVIDAIQDWLITTIVKQAVTKIVSMFNPAGAIVQAVLMIYNVVMFVVERAAQIMEFVEAVINSVHQIATGVIGTAVSWIERALANMIPIMIGFLASLIGLGGISAKIKEFILKVQAKVDQAIDKMIGKAVGWVKKAFGRKSKGKEGAEVKAKVAADLSGKKLKDTEEEKALIASVYNKYKPEGLKGIRFKPTKNGGIDVIVSASLAEKVAQIDLSTPGGFKELSSIVGMMSPYAGRTTIMVYYGKSSKKFKKITQKKGKAGHAEHWLMLEFPSLMEKIRREYKTTKTPLLNPVPVLLEINRTPCDGCATSHLQKMIDDAKNAYPDVKINLTIKALSISQGAQLTTEKGLMALMAKDIEITSSTVWTEIKKQMKANGIKQIDYKNRHYDIDDINEFIASASDVQQLIDKTVKSVNKSKPITETKGSGT